jgi:hypothetical protein
MKEREREMYEKYNNVTSYLVEHEIRNEKVMRHLGDFFVLFCINTKF